MTFNIADKRYQSKSLKSFFLNFFVPLSSVIAILFFLPLYTPWIFNKDAKALKEWFPNPINFVLLHKKRILDENIAALTNSLIAKEPIASLIPKENIWIDNNGLENMNFELLKFNLSLRKNKPKVKGFWGVSNGKYLKARINIRGTRPNHQMIWKPSLKIRLKKNTTHEGFREKVFIAPEDPIALRNWISSELGRKWGLITNLESFSQLYINNKNFGLYNKVSPFNESLLIRLNRLPGPIFDFNIYNKQLFFVSKKQWYEPVAWKTTEKKYKNLNHFLNGPIKSSMEILNWTPDSNYLLLDKTIDLNHYISQEEFAKYLAILNHGGEKHYLNNHNALFWFNPSSGLLEPIINDQNGYGLSDSNKWIKNPIIKNEGAFVRAWFKNPLNQAIYVDKLNKLINTVGNKKNIEKMIYKRWEKIRPILKSETFLSYYLWPARIFFPINKLDPDVERLVENIELRLDWIKKELNRDKVILTEKNDKNFQVLVRGFSGVTVKRKNKSMFNFSNLGYSTYYNKLFIEKLDVTNGVLLPSKSIIKSKNEFVSFDNSYSFFNLSGKPSEYIFSHRLSGKKIGLSNLQSHLNIEKLAIFSGINYLNFLEKDVSPIILGPGNVVIKENKVFSPGQSVTIRGGTNIVLDQGIQVVIQGPLNIEGTRKDPVFIKPIDPEKPYGVFAVLGNKTSGSKINYLNMAGGSVGKFYNSKFSGMLSIHECPNIKILNSRFGKNYIGDDAVHIINSKVLIKDTEFKNSNMDALDLDLVSGTLVSNRFINPGNDGLDLSMSDMITDKNSFIGCKDKCISVGEGTTVKVKNSNIRNCNIGIAVKDKSFATLKESMIQNCNIAWNSYRKKWRWELGGRGEIINSKLINSKTADIVGDKYSSLILSGKNQKKIKINGKIKVN
jgi:hypothetical protein